MYSKNSWLNHSWAPICELGQRLVLVLMVCLFALFSGCGSSENSDELAKQFVTKINQIADALESNEPQETVDQLMSERNALGKKILKLGLSQTQQEEFDKKHKLDIEAAEKRLLEAQNAKKASPDAE